MALATMSLEKETSLISQIRKLDSGRMMLMTAKRQ
jgi:hypothetical protein